MDNNKITHLLKDWRDGDGAALDELTPLVYDRLHDRRPTARPLTVP